MLLEDYLTFLLDFLYHSERYLDYVFVIRVPMALQTTNNDQ